MKIKRWLATTGMVAMLSGTILTGLPTVNAMAAGGPNGHGAGNAINSTANCTGVVCEDGTLCGTGVQHGTRNGGGTGVANCSNKTYAQALSTD